MKIGKSDSMETITPAHWQKMAEETCVSWPMLRERIVHFSKTTHTGLQDEGVRQATNDISTVDRVTAIIKGRATSLVQRLK